MRLRARWLNKVMRDRFYPVWEHITTIREKSWAWFAARAHSRHAVAWVGFLAFAESVFSPIVPEALIAALVLARPDQWRRYAIVGSVWAVIGAAVGYGVAAFFFHTLGEPLIRLYHLEKPFLLVQETLRDGVFWTMLTVAFAPIPDKVFIYASGFMGASFLPYLVGFSVGRIARFVLVAYSTARWGARAVEVINRYLFWLGVLLLAGMVWYGIVRFNLLPL